MNSLINKDAQFKSRPIVFTCGDDDNDVGLARAEFVAYACFPKKSGSLVREMRELEMVGAEGGLKR